MNPTYDRLAAQQLRQAFDTLTPNGDSPEARARVVAAMTAALVAPLPRRRSVLGPVLAVAAAAAVAFGVLALRRPVQGDFNGAQRIELAGGASVALTQGSRVSVFDEGARVLIREGEVAADVVGRDVLLETTDSQVSVRAARVKVTAGAGCDGRALVVVNSGSVVVSSGAQRETVKAGEQWPRCGSAVNEVLPTNEPPRVTEPTKPAVSVKPSTRPHALTLSEQNALYEAAVIAQRGGDLTGAVAGLEKVIVGAPESPLAETALVQEFRWLSATQPAAAREAALRYLVRFPMGTARAEAETLVAARVGPSP